MNSTTIIVLLFLVLLVYLAASGRLADVITAIKG